MPSFLFMDCFSRVYSDPCFTTLLPWRGNFSIFSDPPPLVTLLLDDLPSHSAFLHLHCFVVSYPCWACFLLELASECLLHHASKCSPYLVQSLWIHWLYIVHPIILPMHDRTRNLGSCIFPKYDACTCLSYHVSFPHIWQIFCCLVSCDQ